MLDHLDAKHGHSVLEIGTGTGFNAALLSEIVGPSGSVTTVEIDRQVADTARDRLAGFDRVRTVLGDATTGTFESAPFDRVISTASVHLGRVPYQWVQQTKLGGVIVTPVRADLTSGPLVRFIVHGDGTATGRMVPMGVQFMEVHSQRTARIPDDDFDWQDDTADHTTTTIKPWL
ncbi:MAG: protein-L-isoaspartate O-methyltransferase family protein, partial [Pseudonocardiaceae bacterium]